MMRVYNYYKREYLCLEEGENGLIIGVGCWAWEKRRARAGRAGDGIPRADPVVRVCRVAALERREGRRVERRPF